jgi:RHH-type proline utilization regulon transcriptional repressor/proline dehydrogenase/delta 1-pyrroline-5-carboxylate dehydrogenase
MSLCVREAGKAIPDAMSEVREAVDYCRYYALCAREQLARPLDLPGPTGESNRLSLHARGVFACISPWNFPLAIFTGQVAAALAAGNAVVAKPAEQTPLIAQAGVALLYEAGIPRDLLQLACGRGETIGAALIAHPAIAGVVFTGSVDTARAINQTLAARPGAIVPLIAETGGQNAMIVDSSALAEQVVADVIISAFNSAGQRCSALRLLFLQEEIAPQVIAMLGGAMQELKLGDPALPSTDIGPVIDEEARSALRAYIDKLKRRGTLIAEIALSAEHGHGCYVAPVAVEIGFNDIPDREVFGPVLHVIRYRAEEFERVLGALNATGYALTLGIQSRIDRFTAKIRARFGAGNTYVNRNMIGAVVGLQPFGGERLSALAPRPGDRIICSAS